MRKFLKLLKYDFCDNLGTFVLINGILCILAALIKFAVSSNGRSVLLTLMAGMAILGFIASFVFLIIFIVKLFHSRLFSSDGYLTFSLPVSLDAILTSRILVAGSYVILNGIVGILVIIALSGSLAKILPSFIGLIPLDDIRAYLILTNYILEIIAFLCILLATLAILNTGKIVHFRAIIGIVIFIFLYSVSNIPYMIAVGADYIFEEMIDTVGLIKAVLFSMLKIAVFYLIARYLIKNKLEI